MPEHLNLFDIFGNSFEDTGLRTCGALIFTAVWERTASKYGDFSYILSLLEAGHMAQNILLIATALGVCARPIGGFNDAAVKETLDIDNWEEQTVYTVALF